MERDLGWCGTEFLYGLGYISYVAIHVQPISMYPSLHVIPGMSVGG